jgi:hypothetical protein
VIEVGTHLPITWLTVAQSVQLAVVIADCCWWSWSILPPIGLVLPKLFSIAKQQVPPFGGVGTFYVRMSIADLLDKHNKQAKNRLKYAKFTFLAVIRN